MIGGYWIVRLRGRWRARICWTMANP